MTDEEKITAEEALDRLVGGLMFVWPKGESQEHGDIVRAALAEKDAQIALLREDNTRLRAIIDTCSDALECD